jgi:hypothetical protein
MLAVALAACAGLSACTAQAPGGPVPTTTRPEAPPPLIGAWRSSIQVQSGVFATAKGIEFMYVFHGDRTLVESSNYDAAPPVPPAYGVWRMIPGTGLEHEAKYEFFTTAAPPPEQFKTAPGWLPSGRGVVTERITLARDGKTFTSTLRYDLFDRQGAPIAGGGTATGRGIRIDF